MLFGLSDTPSTFMRVMNQLLRPFISKLVVVYSRSKEEHVEHLGSTFQVLQQQRFYLNLKKCIFMSNCHFFGLSLHKDLWQIYRKLRLFLNGMFQPVTKVQSFHGLATFYQCFVQNFSTLITNCTKKVEFQWASVTNCAFEKIKRQMTSSRSAPS